MRKFLWRAMPVVVALVFPTPARAETHAGIEVGGRGIKATAIDATVTKEGYVYTRLYADTYNTTLSVLHEGAFRKEAIADAANGIARFFKTFREKYKVPAERIHVVGSSGLPKATNWDDFVAAVRKATGKQIHFIDDRTEVALSIAGIVPRTYRDVAILLDIGGGNTKGGFQLVGQPLAYFSVPFGAVSYAVRARQEAMVSKKTFLQAAGGLREEVLVKPMRAGAGKMPGLAKRNRAYLSGGTLWAMIAFTHPEQVDLPYVTFTAADLNRYCALVAKTEGKLPTPDLSKIADPDRRKKALKEVAAVKKTYTPENLIAGAEILKALSASFDLEKRTLVFPRYAYVGWLSAYVVGEGLGTKGPKR